MTMTPYENRIVIEPDETQGKSTGGLIIPDTGKEKALQGKVVAVGPGLVLPNGNIAPCVTKVGDKVVYPKFGCHTFEFENKEYLVIRESDLFVNVETK